MIKNNTTKIVQEIGAMNITGNVIPPLWYQNIKTPTGKTAFLAINLLADIVYWYRPTIIRDEETGNIIEYKKKFAKDKLLEYLNKRYTKILDKK